MQKMDQNKSLSFAEYDRLCRESCEGFIPSGSKDADEELLLRRICHNVFAYLDQEFFISPVLDTTDLEAYKWTLQRLVANKQSDSFDTLAVPGKYINETLSRSYG